MKPEETRWVEQAKKMLALGPGAIQQMPPFAVSMLTYFYGANSVQLRAYIQRIEQISREKSGTSFSQFACASGFVENTIREIENGLVANLRTAIEGELLGDLARLSREALCANTEERKNVAAVLADNSCRC